MKSHPGYGEVIFDEACNEALVHNIEYKFCLTLSGAIGGTSNGKF